MVQSASLLPAYVLHHAPILWLHSNESYFPSDILSHVQRAAPWKKDSSPLDAKTPLDLNTLSTLNSFGEDVYLNLGDNWERSPKVIPDETIASAIIVVNKSETVHDAFYFYFYAFNEGADINQVLPPFRRFFPDIQTEEHFGNHVGDWEHNMVRFENGVPTGIYFSQHSEGQECKWRDTKCMSMQGDRPVVFVAKGSHANYPKAGTPTHDDALMDLTNEGSIWDPTKAAYHYWYDPVADDLTSAHIENDPTDWFHFSGRWGDCQFPDSDARQRTTSFGLKKFESGPRGPKFKQLLRTGIQPERPRKSLLRYVAQVYAFGYSCLSRQDFWVAGLQATMAVLGIIFLYFLYMRNFCRRSTRAQRNIGKVQSE